MENVIDFLEYKKRKEENEIESLRQELADLIEDMGGIHVVPMMLQSDYFTSYTPLPASSVFTWPTSGYDIEYSELRLHEQGPDGSSE